MIKELEHYLKDISEHEKFKTEINTRWGYLRFSNTSDKYFAIGIDAVLQTLKDINQNLSLFQGNEMYVEKTWRDLGSEFYTDSTANAMATVQTKPLFCTLSKIISWANNFTIEDYEHKKIFLDLQELDITIAKLEDLLIEYPEPDADIRIYFPNKEPNTIYYGAPGTGKSHTIKEKLEAVPNGNKETVTFHPDYDYVSFVGGYRPTSDENDENNIKYRFVPQVFTNMYVRAWKNPQEQFYLVIEEINRGNCAEIFGDIFQLLDQNQNYTVTPSNELKAHLVSELSDSHEGIVDGLRMPNNLSILATMNTSDQSLFPMDSAFKRRWDWEYIPINYEVSEDNPSSKFKVFVNDQEYFYWLDFIRKVNSEIKTNPNLGMDKCIGNYFIKPQTDSITLKIFINKAMFYLWNDVFKDEFGSESIFAEDVTYEDFFPIETNGKSQIESILVSLDIEVHTVMDTASNEDTN
ncbi:McrB family protein [Psychrobacter sp. K31L]|uniref:McrB family protein n=1 Tax=Psychrobacter sp. K31L TaxID=2820758 RepID=UPI001B338284|nr:AAA family ATPase [Psychrobacter sp. K31L]MBP3946323.1 AAA family ATPase [Psychrobacter sp. K31L]